jgi:glycerol uptake facilitator-like aquaporin
MRGKTMMLPRMTIGNWLFWSIMLWIGFNFAWLRFVEGLLPQWLGALIATVLAVVLFKYGPRPNGEEEED